jgi:hypothetical protein
VFKRPIAMLIATGVFLVAAKVSADDDKKCAAFSKKRFVSELVIFPLPHNLSASPHCLTSFFS